MILTVWIWSQTFQYWRMADVYWFDSTLEAYEEMDRLGYALAREHGANRVSLSLSAMDVSSSAGENRVSKFYGNA